MIGNRVYIAPNAILIGGIEIGEDVIVGAGAVVTKSVPPRAVVAGNPARIISYGAALIILSTREWKLTQLGMLPSPWWMLNKILTRNAIH